MGDIYGKFNKFCDNMLMSKQSSDIVRNRYYRIQGCLNAAFWADLGFHTRYVGSYGRGTAIHLSDKLNEEMAFSDEEIDAFLPKELRKGVKL